MPKIMQNLVLLMEPSKDSYKVSLKCGSMCLNRFSIDEDAAFEFSGIHYLKTTDSESIDMKLARKLKGKRYLLRLKLTL